ncbi:hypothetical protein [Halpernia frigidisoli]|uniref:Uncharacterized protein n=1 Tax=Halpernia frigidisoli TaxID=1125876 RepID=A0A1I3E7J6_9FLAO|nr:hypothetical protein [Halpernia frigidisoli]SFH94813.1 hypothetical protein SAMN05443292_0914 [Halpernia frigidisoli]
MEDKKNAMEDKKENQDFQNIPQKTSEKGDQDLKKEDVRKASELNDEGKTDNTEKNN